MAQPAAPCNCGDAAGRAMARDAPTRRLAPGAAIGYLTAHRRPRASWRSGYAADCKSVHTGSIPVLASTLNQWVMGFAGLAGSRIQTYHFVPHRFPGFQCWCAQRPRPRSVSAPLAAPAAWRTDCRIKTAVRTRFTARPKCPAAVAGRFGSAGHARRAARATRHAIALSVWSRPPLIWVSSSAAAPAASRASARSSIAWCSRAASSPRLVSTSIW